jgi:putative membrane protein
MKHKIILLALSFFTSFALADIAADAQKLDDSALLSRIHSLNQDEVKVGGLAAKSANQKVAAFGNRLVKDHGDADAKILTVAQQNNVQIGQVVAVSDDEKKRLEAHQATVTALSSATGADFDKQFVAAMVKGHADAVTMLESAKPQKQNVAALVQELLPAIREHLALAQQLSAEQFKE